jgi:hypothetical protein
MGVGRPKISDAGRNKLNNSISRIQINGKHGTGFFMKIEINGEKKNYLIANNQIISQEQIDSKANIDLMYGQEFKTISLDKNIRNIQAFENGVILVEIIQNDGISENKYLSVDLNYQYGYEAYQDEKVCTIGYNNTYTERELSSGEIISIINSKFNLNLNTNLGSPICSIKNQFVIGIYKEANNGIFIGEIIDSLKKENGQKINNVNSNNNVNNNNNVNSNNDRKRYYYFDENKEKYILFNKNVLKHFHRQNEANFNTTFNDLKTYLSDKKENNLENILDILQNFKKIENYDKMLKKCLGVQGLLDKINYIIRRDDDELYEKFYYFIAAFLNALENSECRMKNQTQLFRGAIMDKNQLSEYKKNINKLIFYKGFCPATKERAVAAVFGSVLGNNNGYSVIETINYKYKNNWRPYCFDISKFDTFLETKTALFTLYTCFKIKGVKINEENRTAEILLDSVGIKMDENKEKINDIIYNLI